MLDLQSLSKIGFGCYRVSINSHIHRSALQHALDLGCNLIDTASSYMNGQSEELVGAVLNERPNREAFVITKAGYVGPQDEVFLASAAGVAANRETVYLPDGTQHCIHPDFLKVQIERSLKRLNRSFIDGFLLHNPEYFLRLGRERASTSEFYRRIKQGFNFLEDMVHKRMIRFYGVSSNTLLCDSKQSDAVCLDDLVQAGQNVADTNYFRFIQFPCNLAEWSAVSPTKQGASFVERARQRGLITIANRPLNAKVNGRLVRLALDAHVYRRMEPVVSLLDQTVATLNRQLELLGIDGDIEDAPAIHALRTRLTAFDNTEIIDDFFQQVLGPLLKRLYPTNLYPDGIPATDQEKFNNLHVAARCHAQLMMNSAAESLRDDLVTQGRIADNKRSLPLAACEAVLKAGVDHVLVGMRRKEYVDTLSSLFGSPQNGSSVCH